MGKKNKGNRRGGGGSGKIVVPPRGSPVNRLPTDVFVQIPLFFTRGILEYAYFPMVKPLIRMTHVCRTWRNVLLATPNFWTQIDFSMSTSSQQETFLHRSGNHPLRIRHCLEDEDDDTQPFLSFVLRNLFRVQELSIVSSLLNLEPLLKGFSPPAPELKYLTLINDSEITETDINLPKIFGGQMPKLLTLELGAFRSNLREFNLPFLTRFYFSTETKISFSDLTSFFERCPLLEYIEIGLSYIPLPPLAPPLKRICLAALKELILDQTASTCGLLDHLILPKCIKMSLMKDALDDGYPAPRIHPSSVDHLSVMRGITKVVAMPNSFLLSGPNGTLRIWCSNAHRELNSDFFVLFPPISIFEIKQLWVGRAFLGTKTPWMQTTAGVCGAFKLLTKVEELTIVSCETKPIFTVLGSIAPDSSAVLLPGLRRLMVYVGFGNLDVSALIQCISARNGHSTIVEVTIVWEEAPVAEVMHEVETLKEFVGDLTQRVGRAPSSFGG